MWWLEILAFILLVILLLSRLITILAGVCAVTGVLLYLAAELLKVAFHPKPFQIVLVDYDEVVDWILKALYGATTAHAMVMAALLIVQRPAPTNGAYTIVSLLLILFWKRVHEEMSKPLG